jgi:signal transduction histidine kinase
LGDRLQVGYEYYNRSQKINFEFPFFGKTYFDIYATSSGMITLGEVFYHPNMQTCCIRFPAIFPLMVDLDAAGGRGVFARQETDRLIVTWDHVPALYQANQVFTFQAILYQSGAFDITYNGLPQPIRFNPDATPSANPWIRGITPGLGEAIDEGSVSDLSQSAQSGAGGLRQNFYLDFRTYLHQFTLPLAWMVFIGSLLLLLTLPILLRFVIIRPLNALLAGVYQMEAGNLKVEIPVQSPDDIGYLTNSFNKMASTLNGQVAVLEQRVSERTSELVAANERLRAEMESREEAQAQVLEQQRILTTLKERQRLARNLHDSLSQSFQSLVLFSETLIAAIEKNNLERIKQLAERVYESARQSHKETRLILYELQAPGRERSVNLIEDLEERLSKVETHAGVSSQIIQKGPLNAIPSAWHEDLYWITIEALNNALKHAQAHKIQIVIHVSPQEMELEVVDDGRGFAPDHILVGGMGLENMSARAQLLGGELTVESEPTKGTRVRFHAKIKAE